MTSSMNVTLQNAAFDDETESVEEQLLGFLGRQGIAISKSDMSACHVLKTKDETKKPPIIIRLVNRKSQINTLENGRKLKGTNVYINEHLSRKNANISALARQLKRLQRIHLMFTRNCKVFVKTNGVPGVSRVMLIKDINFRSWINLMATDIAKCSMCNIVAPLSELTTDKLADIEYGNYCWHCNECTSIFPFIGINDAELIDENVAYENSYDLGKTHETFT